MVGIEVIVFIWDLEMPVRKLCCQQQDIVVSIWILGIEKCLLGGGY